MKIAFHIFLFFACTTALLMASTVDWPAFRGPTGQGVSEAVNPPVDWNLEEHVIWKTKIPGRGWSSPVLAHGKIVLTTGIEEVVNGLHQLKVVQVDADSGIILWEKTVLHGTEEEAADRNAKNSLASPTPLLANGVIYAHFGHMGTVALDFDDGEILWKQKIFYIAKNGNGATPILVDDLLVYTTDGFEDPVVTALHADTGKIAWRTTRSHRVKNNFSHGTPLVINNHGRTEIISPGSGMVGAYNPENGREIWRVTYPMGFSMTTRPIFVGNYLYMGTGFSRPSFYKIRVDGSTGDLTDTHVEWKYHKSMPKTPSPNFVKGNVITLEDGGRLQCLDAETGKLRWMKPLKGKFSASPVQVNDLLYCISEEGLCFVIQINDDGCEILSENDFEEETLASPAIVDHTLYVRTDQHLWKIEN